MVDPLTLLTENVVRCAAAHDGFLLALAACTTLALLIWLNLPVHSPRPLVRAIRTRN
jgi:hypothetical protein